VNDGTESEKLFLKVIFLNELRNNMILPNQWKAIRSRLSTFSSRELGNSIERFIINQDVIEYEFVVPAIQFCKSHGDENDWSLLFALIEAVLLDSSNGGNASVKRDILK